MAKDFEYEIVEEFGVLEETKSGWTKEFNLIKYGDSKPVYDIRTWSPEDSENGKKMSKGITLSKEGILELKTLLEEIDID